MVEDEGPGATPTPEALEPTVELHSDAHEAWHEAFDAYHDPREFRRRIEVLIQTLRNVTWRLQAAKKSLPGFDDWYPNWQNFFKDNREMRWLNEARLDVVKRSGLASSSRALVRIIDSYLPAWARVWELPAATPTSAVLGQVRSSIKEEVRPYTAVEIYRRWEVEALPGAELLSALGRCWHLIEALVVYSIDAANGAVPNENLEDFLLSIQKPICMQVDPALLAIMIEADTGEPIVAGQQFLRRDDRLTEQAAKRYGSTAVDMSQEPVPLAKALHELARRIFSRDGDHVPVVWFRLPDKSWEMLVHMPADKREKYVFWHAYADYVAAAHVDAVIHTSEVWRLKASAAPAVPYLDISSPRIGKRIWRRSTALLLVTKE